jgi:hypothetical protein
MLLEKTAAVKRGNALPDAENVFLKQKDPLDKANDLLTQLKASEYSPKDKSKPSAGVLLREVMDSAVNPMKKAQKNGDQELMRQIWDLQAQALVAYGDKFFDYAVQDLAYGDPQSTASSRLDVGVDRYMMQFCPEEKELRAEVEKSVAKVHCAWAAAVSYAYRRWNRQPLNNENAPDINSAVQGAYAEARKHCSPEELSEYKSWAADLVTPKKQGGQK